MSYRLVVESDGLETRISEPLPGWRFICDFDAQPFGGGAGELGSPSLTQFYYGGMVGTNAGQILSSSSHGTQQADITYNGGLVGQQESTGQILRSYSSADVYGMDVFINWVFAPQNDYVWVMGTDNEGNSRPRIRW